MIRLTEQMPRAPWRATFDGLPYPLWMLLRPPSSALMEAARAKSMESAPALVTHIAEVLAAGGEVTGLLDMGDAHASQGLAMVAYARALAELAVVEWGGAAVEDPATGQVVPPSPEIIGELMLWPGLPGRFIAKLHEPIAGVLAEGKGSGTASPGTSGAVPIIADPAPTKVPPAPAASGA